jgi:pilus assembly protein Flp/PilA
MVRERLLEPAPRPGCFLVTLVVWSLVMHRLLSRVRRFVRSEDGPTAVEYAVMLALIVVVCLASIQAIGTRANETFNSVSNQLGSTTAS